MATRAQAKKAIEQHEDELAGYPNVVGIGTTGEQDEVKVKLYVSALPDQADAMPEFVELETKGGLERVEVTIEEVGTIEPGSAPPSKGPPASDEGFSVE